VTDDSIVNAIGLFSTEGYSVEVNVDSPVSFQTDLISVSRKRYKMEKPVRRETSSDLPCGTEPYIGFVNPTVGPNRCEKPDTEYLKDIFR
jgi:hypothetical protein